MSDDWRPGDIAECVEAGPMVIEGFLTQACPELVEGATYTVAELTRCICCNRPGFRLAEFGEEQGAGYDIARFRKYRSSEIETLIAGLSAPAPADERETASTHTRRPSPVRSVETRGAVEPLGGSPQPMHPASAGSDLLHGLSMAEGAPELIENPKEALS